MSKFRFSGFPDGSRVTTSTLKGGVARGPVMVSAWKQATPQPGTLSFEIYSNQAPVSPQNQENPYGQRGSVSGPNREMLDGDVIELMQYHGLGLYIENVQGSAVTLPNGEADLRRMFVEIDFGERWDSEAIDNHPYMPPWARTTRDPDGITMGRYRGYAAGHAMRGTDMSGNQVLTKDYQEGSHPPGIKETTVTVTVSDGINTATKSFKVLLTHWLRYHTDVGQTTYGVNSYRGSGSHATAENRRGVIYIAADGDFTGAEIGPNIYHYHASEIRTWFPFCRNNHDLEAQFGETLRHTSNATQIIGGVACDAGGTPVPKLTDFPWNSTGTTYALVFKSGPGNVYEFGPDGSSPGFIAPGANCIVTSWGGGRAEISGERMRRWTSDPKFAFQTTAFRGYQGLTFHNIYFRMSDLDITEPTQRVWWNVLYYENKSGTFTENTNSSLVSFPYNGELLRNSSSTVFTEIISDWPDPQDSTRGYLIVRQILDQPEIDGDAALNATEVTFTDGEQIIGDTSGATVTFVQAPAWGAVNAKRGVDATSRQNRPKKVPGAFWATQANLTNSGLTQVTFDKCIVKGVVLGFSNPGSWFFRSDFQLLDVENYSWLGSAHAAFDSACVVANPWKANPDPDNYIKDTNAVDGANKGVWNANKQGLPRIPTLNGVGHCVQRMWGPTVYAQHKCMSHWYGGHTGSTNINDDFGWGIIYDGGSEQPCYRMHRMSGWHFNDPNIERQRGYILYQGGIYVGGSLVFEWNDWNPIDKPVHFLVYDNCILQAGKSTQAMMNLTHSRSAIKNCWFGWPAELDIGPRGRLLMAGSTNHITFNANGERQDLTAFYPDPNPMGFVENTEFVYASGNIDPTTTVGVVTEHRGSPITYTNCTVTIGEPDSNPGVPAIPAQNVAAIP